MKLAATPTYSPYIDLEVTFFVREDLRGKTAFTFAVLSYTILEIKKKQKKNTLLEIFVGVFLCVSFRVALR